VFNTSHKVITDAIAEGDKDLSKWYLERRDKSRFAARQEHTGEEGKAIELNNTISTQETNELRNIIAKLTGNKTDIPELT
jgi:hypothetical protein